MIPSTTDLSIWDKSISIGRQKGYESEAFYLETSKNILKFVVIAGGCALFFTSLSLSFYPRLAVRSLAVLLPVSLKAFCDNYLTPQKKDALYTAEKIERVRIRYFNIKNEPATSLLEKELKLSEISIFSADIKEHMLNHPFLKPLISLIQEARANLEQAIGTEKESEARDVVNSLWYFLYNPGVDFQKKLPALI